MHETNGSEQAQESAPKTSASPEPKLAEKVWWVTLISWGLPLSVFAVPVLLVSGGSVGLGIFLFIIGLLVWQEVHVRFLEPRRFATQEDLKLYRKLKREKAQKKSAEFLKSYGEKHAQEYYSKRIAARKPLACPKCGSQQLHTGQRGFKVGRAVAVGVLTGGAGALLAGAAGKNQIMVTCIHCGHAWKAGS